MLVTPSAAPQPGNEQVNGHNEAARGPEKAMQFTVTFSNLTTEDMSVSPGTLIDCGRNPAKTNAIHLNLTDSAGNPHQRLPYLGDGPPYQGGCCAGQIIPFVAVLHAGESSSLPLDIGKYLDLSDSKQYNQARFPAGTYSLQLELTVVPSQSHAGPVKAWAGRVSSNIIKIHFDSRHLWMMTLGSPTLRPTAMLKSHQVLNS